MKPESRGLVDRLGGPLVLFGLAGLVVGVALAPVAWNAATGPQGTVAVVEVHGTITGETATAAVGDLREARRDDSIRAVVLDVNSPGGTAAASEQLYLAVDRTAEEMPVVAAVTGTAASGGYYASIPADRIYVTPAGAVGSVGVRAVVPPEGVSDDQIVSGPDKATTATEREARRRVETLRRAFVGAVFEERGENLSLSRRELSYAKVYSGSRGVQLGLADEVGGLGAAIADAGERAEMGRYATTRFESPTQDPLSQLGIGTGTCRTGGDSAAENCAGASVQRVRYLMVHGQLQRPDTADAREVSVNATN